MNLLKMQIREGKQNGKLFEVCLKVQGEGFGWLNGREDYWLIVNQGWVG